MPDRRQHRLECVPAVAWRYPLPPGRFHHRLRAGRSRAGLRARGASEVAGSDTTIRRPGRPSSPPPWDGSVRSPDRRVEARCGWSARERDAPGRQHEVREADAGTVSGRGGTGGLRGGRNRREFVRPTVAPARTSCGAALIRDSSARSTRRRSSGAFGWVRPGRATVSFSCPEWVALGRQGGFRLQPIRCPTPVKPLPAAAPRENPGRIDAGMHIARGRPPGRSAATSSTAGRARLSATRHRCFLDVCRVVTSPAPRAHAA